MKQPKTYFAWVNDHSGSMSKLADAALKDFNSNIGAVVRATSEKQLDAIVSVIRLGIGDGGRGVDRHIVNSNPHVLKPMDAWPTPGGTPLYDAIGNTIELLESLPDAKEEHVSMLVTITTDGDERHSQVYDQRTIKRELIRLQHTGRWTFVFRVPMSCVHNVADLGVPMDNIQPWETTEAGMAQSTAATQVAIDNYVTTRAAGKKATGGFFSGTEKVNLAQLEEVTKDYSLYVSGDLISDTDGMMISDFILARRMKYLKGAAFYQLVKTEARVQPDKCIVIRERTTGKIYAGDKARDMVGIPRNQNVRLHPGQHGNYDVFIQSSSWNRKVPTGSGVLYNEKLGVEFTQEELDKFTKPADPKVVPQNKPVVQLPAVNNTSGKPVHSTMPVTQQQVVFYKTRDDARRDKSQNGADYEDLGSDKPKGQRFRQTKRGKA